MRPVPTGPYVPPITPEPEPPFWVRWSRRATGLDWPLLGLVVLMALAGTLEVYSTTVPFALTRTDKAPFYFVQRHLLFVLAGMLLMLGLAVLDYRRLQEPRWLLPMSLGMAGALLVLDIRNLVTGTASRTLFGGSVQPGEWIKPMLVIYLAAWLTRKARVLRSPRRIWWYGGWVTGLVVTLLLLQPDLSSAGTAGLLGLFMLVLVGMKPLQMFLAFGTALITAGVGLRLAMAMYPPAADRLQAYILAWTNPTAVPGHMRQAFYAFLRGGWFGLGPGEARGKIYALPLPHTDSVYAVIGEEWGTLGALLVLVLFVLFLWRGLYIALKAQDAFGRLLAAGLTFWLVVEAFVHMGGMVGLIPQAGNALPFFSYGGSNLVASMAAVGLILSVAAHRTHPPLEEQGHVVVDLRGRDRRRGLSRPGRASTPARGG